MSYRAACVIGLSGMGLIGTAVAGPPEGSETKAPPAGPIQLETFGDAPGEPAAGGTGVASVIIHNGFTSVQTNVDGAGNNIAGDAANEPSIAIDPNAPNRIAVGWRQFDTTGSNFREAGYNFSVDGGRTWSAKGEIESGLFRSDPVLASDRFGRFYYLSITTDLGDMWECDLFVSIDGGQTWPTKHFAFGGDKSWFATDDFSHGGETKLYQGWNVAGNEYAPAQFSRSVDAGASWIDPVEYDPPRGARPVFGQVAVASSGVVYVAGITNGGDPADVWVTRSSNAQMDGVTPTFDVAHIDLSPGGFAGFDDPNPGGLLGQVNISVDRSGGPTDGNVYVLLPVAGVFSGGDVDLALLRSTDGGATFDAPIRVTPNVTGLVWKWFGTMSVAPNGRLDVVFNSNRDAPGNARLHKTYYTFSVDAGTTWSAAVEIGPQWDSYLGWPNQNKIGDYYDIRSDLVGAHLIYATTYNGEQDVYYCRIGDYDCNGNGVGDSQDIALGGDCDGNGILDACEIAAGVLMDSDGDGIPDICECPADLDGDGDADGDDFFAYLDLFAAGDPDADLDGDGDRDADDFFAYLDLFALGC